MRPAASAAALKAGAPEAFDDRPQWLKDHDGDESYAWARTAWANAAATPGAWYDHQLADAVVEDWPNWATLTLDRFAGVKFKLGPWQELTVRLLVGWMIPIEILDPESHETRSIHIRLFRRLMLWIPRKNGKSEFLAALALLFFVIDGVPQGEGYVFARKESQAFIVFSRMAAMVKANEEFKSEVIAYQKSLYVKAFAAKFEVLSGSVEGLHGKSPTVIVGDEMHEWKSLVIVDTLRQGTGGRLQPIELYASTAGRRSNGTSVGEQLYDESRQIVDGRKIDPTTLVVIFAANDNDDPGDEAAWRRANPSLGLSPTLHFLRQEYAKALGNPRAMAHFKCYHLGIWADEVVRWIPLKKWDACAATKDGWKRYPETLRGRQCFLAFDISATTDVTALVLVFPPTDDDPKWRVLSRFWIPEDQVERRVAEGAPVDQFIAAGAMETTAGDYVDQNVVGEAILEACRDYDVQKIGFDPWNAAKLYTDLCADGGILDGVAGLDESLFQEVRQGIRSLGEPSKHFERLVFAGAFDHGGQPVLRWMAGNTVIAFDRNLNFMPAKDRSSEKIDGVMASVMAVGLATQNAEDSGLDDYLRSLQAAA
jgi:phage terminase large subunit-like protein